MTNILILHPDIPQQSALIDDSSEWESLHSINNAFGGFRSAVLRSMPTASSTLNLTYTLPTGTTKAANFLYIPRFKKRGVDSWGGDLALQNSSDGVSWSDVLSIANVNNAAMNGFREDDLFRSFAVSDARQYWRIAFSSIQTPRRVTIGTPFFGTALDLGADWSNWSITSIDDDRGIYTQVDSVFTGKTGEYRREISAEWRGVSSAKVVEFDSAVTSKHQLTSFILYASSHDFVTDEDQFIHCKLKSVRHIKSVNQEFSTISAVFEEQ